MKSINLFSVMCMLVLLGISINEANAFGTIDFDKKAAEDLKKKDENGNFINDKSLTFNDQNDKDSSIPKGDHCCSSGICKVGNLEWSCNLIENTPIDNGPLVEVSELLSFIALDTESKKKLTSSSVYSGTKDFCQACYNKILEVKFPDKSKDSFDNTIAKIKNEIAKDGVERVYINRFIQHYEHQKFYKKYKKQIDKSLHKKIKSESERIRFKKRLLCIPENHFDTINDKEKNDCPDAIGHLNSFLQKHKMSNKKHGKNSIKIKENKKFYDKDVTFRINRVMHKKMQKIEMEYKDFKNRKKDTDSFNQIFTKNLINAKSEIFAYCSNLEAKKETGSIKEIYSLMIDDKNKNISKSELSYLVEGFEQMVTMANIANPDLMLITRNITTICDAVGETKFPLTMKSFSLFKRGEDDEQAAKGLLDQVIKDNELDEDNHFAFARLAEMAKEGCNSKKSQREAYNMLCGDIKDSELPLRLDMDSDLLDEDFEKLAFAKMTCSESINVINSSKKNKAYVKETLPENGFYLIGAGGWKDARSYMRESQQKLLDSNNLTGFFQTNKGPQDILESAAKNSGNEGGLGGVADKIVDKNSDKNFVGRLFNGASELEDDGLFSDNEPGVDFSENDVDLFNPLVDANTGNPSILDSEYKYETENIDKDKVGNSQNVFENYTQNDEEKTQDYSTNYNSLDHVIKNNEINDYQIKNQSKFNDLLGKIQGNGEIEKKNNLKDFLNEKKDLEDIKGNNVAGQELESEINELRKEIAAEKARRNLASDPNSIPAQLAAANEKIGNLEKLIHSMRDSNNSNKVNNAPSMSYDTRAQEKVNRYLQENQKRPARDYYIPEGQKQQRVPLPVNIQSKPIGEEKFTEIINKKDSFFEYNNKYKELVLKTKAGDEYTVQISNPKWDDKTGVILSFEYKGKVVNYSELSDNSRAAVDQFLKEKEMAQEIDERIKVEIGINSNAKGPSKEMAKYIDLLCGGDGVDPSHPKCSGYKPIENK